MWKYTYIDHTADLGVKITADSKEEIYQAAALILYENLISLDKIRLKKKIRIRITGKDYDQLLFNILKKLLEYYNINRFVGKQVDIDLLKKDSLCITVSGDFLKEEIPLHLYKHEIKTITYHGLHIKKSGKKFTTNVIFDI
ncbi:MAG: archease [Spirochaetes bacterium]|nr:archease [Spirochaetota bacterium]